MWASVIIIYNLSRKLFSIIIRPVKCTIFKINRTALLYKLIWGQTKNLSPHFPHYCTRQKLPLLPKVFGHAKSFGAIALWSSEQKSAISGRAESTLASGTKRACTLCWLNSRPTPSINIYIECTGTMRQSFLCKSARPSRNRNGFFAEEKSDTTCTLVFVLFLCRPLRRRTRTYLHTQWHYL
jgi:hypothetical protein